MLASPVSAIYFTKSLTRFILGIQRSNDVLQVLLLVVYDSVKHLLSECRVFVLVKSIIPRLSKLSQFREVLLKTIGLSHELRRVERSSSGIVKHGVNHFEGSVPQQRNATSSGFECC